MPAQKGYISAVVIVFLLIFAVFLFPRTFPNSANAPDEGKNELCRPEDIDNPNAPTVSAPSYTFEDEFTDNPVIYGGNITYKRIKSSVPIPVSSLVDNYLGHWEEKDQVQASDGKTYRLFYPARITQEIINDVPTGKVLGNISYAFEGDGQIHFFKHGMIFLIHLENGSPVVRGGTGNNDVIDFWIADVYMDPDKEPLPDNVLKCKDPRTPNLKGIILKPMPGDKPGNTADTSVVKIPDQSPSLDREELQLEWFLFTASNNYQPVWWTPHCKPAIYLYPKEKTLVNVKVNTKGFLTYVIPEYPTEGWTVTAYPDGKLQSSHESRVTSYGYLYYESKVPDNLIQKPEKGWVVKYEDLNGLYKDILPKLGLNESQTKDFIDYWNKALTNDSPYYFVGVMDQDNINEIEPLEITPKPASINRVRIYFERLDEFKAVEPPELISHQSLIINHQSFNVVEWGGMVKNDLTHPFTCSQ